MWQNRITKYSEEAPDSLLANPKNWRTHPGTQADALRGVLEDVGVVQNVIANERTGFLIDGHLRVMEALKSGQAAIPVTWVDLSEEEEALVLATLDPLGSMAGTDAAQLDDLLRSVSTDNPALAQMLDALATEAGIVPSAGEGGDEFDTTPDEGPTRTQVGELWSLGGVHRLLVGDCTDAGNVARLMGGEKAKVVSIDPPYGVNYNRHIPNPRHSNLTNDTTPDPARLLQNIPDADAWYVWSRWDVLGEWMTHIPLDIRNVIVWDKQTNGMGDLQTTYAPSWEACIFASKPGHILRGGRDRDVWSAARSDSDEHLTPKPLELIERCITKSSDVGDLVIDFFLGSGTTLIAAHRTGRRCYGLELESRYADVILRRAEAEGLTCELISPMVLK